MKKEKTCCRGEGGGERGKEGGVPTDVSETVYILYIYIRTIHIIELMTILYI